MIGSSFVRSLLILAILSSGVGLTAAARAQELPQSLQKPQAESSFNQRTSQRTQNRPATQILERSLGMTSAILAGGAVMLIISRRIHQSMGQKTHNPADFPRITSRVQLTSKQAVHVIRIGNRVLVVGTGPQGAPEMLCEWSSSVEQSMEEAHDPLQDRDGAFSSSNESELMEKEAA